jgi:epoxide hydrolase-like predicted phosphatase
LYSIIVLTIHPVHRYVGAMPITAVAFDFGGVLAKSPSEALEAYAAELDLPPGTFLPFFRGDRTMAALETGRISGREFFKYVCIEVEAHHGVRVDIRALAGAAAAGEALDPPMLDLVGEVRERCATALLTNNVREAGWRETFPFELFDVVVDSSDVGVRKPDPAIYRELLGRLDRPAAEVAFVDDRPENLPPAAALGVSTIAVVDEGQCRAELVRLGALAVPVR